MGLRKFRPRRKRGFTASHIFALCCGCDFFKDTFGQNGEALITMRAAWPALRLAAFELQQQRRPGTLPMGFYYFEAPPRYRLNYLDPRPENEAEIVQRLRRAGKIPAITEANKPVNNFC
jgi:hypothetical protein